MRVTKTIEELRAELDHQQTVFEQARSVLQQADESTFVSAELVEQLEDALALVQPRAIHTNNTVRL
jgi:hypothetical protein